MPDNPHSSPLDHAFQAWLEQLRSGNSMEAGEFLATRPEELREDLRRMMEDYQSLQESLGNGSSNFEEGRLLDDYRLIHELGRGGMGSVWEAEQLSLKRRVALKLLKPQFSFSPVSLLRFQREAEAGGRLQHVGIVQTYGTGETEGIHWIAQELVVGGFTLADSLAQNRALVELPTGHYRDVAQTFAAIADALEHAHSHGVVHRDIKPGNILLGEDDRPKIADFGLAQIQDELGLSRTGEYLGTPFYMSPEQAMSKRMGLDHRSDIFSLGATLYEALTLIRAFDGDTSQQVFQKIITEEPDDPRKLRSRVPRDLAVICSKCLEKSPDRRYQSMTAVAEDLRRHLKDQPILAKPPGLLTRSMKWCRRHPVFAVASSVAAVALVVISSLALRIADARDRTEEARLVAVAEATTAQRVIDFLVGLFEVNDPSEALGNSVTARELLDKGTLEIERALNQEPEIQARMMGVMGNVYRALGLYAAAEPLLLQAAKIQRQEIGGDHAQTLVTLNNLATLYYYQGRLAAAEDLFREVLEGSRRVHGIEHPRTLDTLGNLGILCYAEGKIEQAEPLLRESLEVSRRVNGADHPDTLTFLNNYGLLLQYQGRYAEAEPLVHEAYEASRRINGPDHPSTLISLSNYALLLQNLGRLHDAEPLLREELAASRRINGADHPGTLTSLNNLGMLLKDLGALTESEVFLREALEGSRRFHSDDHPATYISLDNLGLLLREQGKLAEAESLVLEALEGSRRTLGVDHPTTLIILFHLTRLYQIMDRPADALPLAQELLGFTAEDSERFPKRKELVENIEASLLEE